MRYCLVTSKRWKELFFPGGLKQTLPSGLWQWLGAFGGTEKDLLIPRCEADMEEYDIVHVNVPRANIPYIRQIAECKPKHTKLVVNIDYSIEMWQNGYEHITVLLRELDKADLIFSVESTMADIISHYLKRPVPVIPHPTNIEQIQGYVKERRNKKPMIAVLGHRYDQNFTLPYFAFHDIDCVSILFGYTQIDAKGIGFYYDLINKSLPIEKYFGLLASCDIAIETALTRSYGRSVVECAILGIPVVGGPSVEAMRIMFPDTCETFAEPRAIHDLIMTLMQDHEYCDYTVKRAQKKVGNYSHETCKNMMLEALGYEVEYKQAINF